MTPILLVHGAWFGAASWQHVAADRAGRGVSVRCIELPGHGVDPTPPEALSLDGYIDAVLSSLPAHTPVTLVGHSMAGIIISAVAARAPERVAHLVYLAAYLPVDGDSLYALSQTDTDSLVPRYWRQDDPAAWSPAWIDDAGLIDVFCADAPPEVQEMVRASHRPEALAPLGTPVHLADASAAVPRVYVHTRDDRAVSYGLQQRMLARAGGASAVVTLEGGHLPMLAQPLVVADLIAGIATRRERHG
jgi:pimeloyl-ACP methyl ester carboxylesterase